MSSCPYTNRVESYKTLGTSNACYNVVMVMFKDRLKATLAIYVLMNFM